MKDWRKNNHRVSEVAIKTATLFQAGFPDRSSLWLPPANYLACIELKNNYF
jgi:hypothetical protein